jgi:hypothetical protein
VVVVALLANAIRKERGEQVRTHGAGQSTSVRAMFPGLGRGRASAEYLRGMRDLLAVLFEGGRATADECYAAAQNVAEGRPEDDPGPRPVA